MSEWLWTKQITFVHLIVFFQYVHSYLFLFLPLNCFFSFQDVDPERDMETYEAGRNISIT